MHRIQVSLKPEQYEQLVAEARRLKISLSALIRRLVDAHLGASPDEEYPLAAVTGIAQGSGEPVGREHNRYLYGSQKR
jgi:hypothetical protein